jgi:hypothetical protein
MWHMAHDSPNLLPTREGDTRFGGDDMIGFATYTKSGRDKILNKIK